MLKNLYMRVENVVNFNKTFDKNELRDLVGWFVSNYGSLKTKGLLDKLKFFGFRYATEAGISLGMDDLKIPPSKNDMVKNIEHILRSYNRRCLNGKLDYPRLLKRENELWSITSENLKNAVLNNLRQTDLLNPLYVMTISGARGNLSQVKQLIGMRGLMSDSQGRLIDLPIKSNFKEGLNIMEYFISCYGARKGIIDTALKTANSGYLTRRLIYAAQALVVKKPDCFTQYNSLVPVENKTKDGYKFLKEKLIGRVVSKTIKDINSGEILISFGQDICNVRFGLLKF